MTQAIVIGFLALPWVIVALIWVHAMVEGDHVI